MEQLKYQGAKAFDLHALNTAMKEEQVLIMTLNMTMSDGSSVNLLKGTGTPAVFQLQTSADGSLRVDITPGDEMCIRDSACALSKKRPENSSTKLEDSFIWRIKLS